MKKRLGVAVVFLMAFAVVLLAVPLIFARGGSCRLASDPNPMYSACDGGNFWTIDSSNGFGAAEICGECYVCGDSDGVCPEDFKNSSNDFIGNCSGCNDVDCLSAINGVVRRLDSLQPVAGAIVRAVPENPSIPQGEVRTFADGTYTLNVPSGKLVVSAASVGLDTEINETLMYSHQNKTIDFFLPNASCDEECANYFGRCNKDCQGVNNCNYADWDELTQSSEVAWLCHERRFNETVIVSQAGDYINSTFCCDGSVSLIEFRPQVIVDGPMKNLITTSTNALYNGIPVTITVATWMAKG